jgi:hypothetical protein
VDGKVACSTGDGVFLLSQQDTTELTRKVRSETQFQHKALTLDRDTMRLVGAASFVIDLENGKVFDYSTAGFLYTTPTITDPRGKSFVPQQLRFVYESSAAGTATLQYKRDEESWSTAETITFDPTSQERPSIADWTYGDRVGGHEWTFRFTALSAGVKIRGIYLYSDRAAKTGGYTGDS